MPTAVEQAQMTGRHWRYASTNWPLTMAGLGIPSPLAPSVAGAQGHRADVVAQAAASRVTGSGATPASSTRVEPATSTIAAAAERMYSASGPAYGSAPVTGGASSGTYLSTAVWRRIYAGCCPLAVLSGCQAHQSAFCRQRRIKCHQDGEGDAVARLGGLSFRG